MASFLKSILGIDDPLFTIGLKSLEKATGNSGVDTRLIADILERTHKVMRGLGLDPKDTTAHELYRSLVSLAKSDRVELLLEDLDYTLCVIDGQIISFNLIDVIENSHHELSFEKQVFSHGQRSLRGEILDRYVKHTRVDDNTAMKIAESIGLLSEQDAWYNNLKHKHKKTTVN